MIAGGGHAVLLEHPAYILHLFPGGAVDHAAPAPPVPDQGQQGIRLVLGVQHLKAQIGPVKTGDHLQGVLQLQNAADVLPHLSGGGGSKGGHHGPSGQTSEKFHDTQIAGAEVLPPLGDTVGLVHRHHGHVQLPDHGQEPVRQQPLRGHIQKAVLPRQQPAAHLVHLGLGEGTVQIGSPHPRFFQRQYLVPHQGDQGGNHHRHPRQQQGGHLIAQALAAPGGHHPKGIPAGQQGIDQLPLPGAKCVIAEVFL